MHRRIAGFESGLVLSLGVLAALASPVALAQQNVDTVVTNGKILTVDRDFRIVQALAIDKGHHQARFEGVASRREALEILAAKAASMPPGEWILVQGGWTPRQFADAPGGFTLEELDRVAPKNPLFVQEGYSFVYANSLALKAIGLDPAGGAKRNAAGLASFQPPT